MNSDDDALQGMKSGQESEDRFYRLLSDPAKVPDWIIGVFPASTEEDHKKGIDFYVLGQKNLSIPVNIKSSFRGKRRKGKLAGICIIVIRRKLDDDTMRRDVLMVLERWKSQQPL